MEIFRTEHHTMCCLLKIREGCDQRSWLTPHCNEHMFLYVTYNQACRLHFYEFQLVGDIKDLFGPCCLKGP